MLPKEVIRATAEEKDYQIEMLDELHKRNADNAGDRIKLIQNAAIQNENIFEELMEACKYCSLGEITSGLFEVGGQYRRNM